MGTALAPGQPLLLIALPVSPCPRALPVAAGAFCWDWTLGTLLPPSFYFYEKDSRSVSERNNFRPVDLVPCQSSKTNAKRNRDVRPSQSEQRTDRSADQQVDLPGRGR